MPQVAEYLLFVESMFRFHTMQHSKQMHSPLSRPFPLNTNSRHCSHLACNVTLSNVQISTSKRTECITSCYH